MNLKELKKLKKVNKQKENIVGTSEEMATKFLKEKFGGINIQKYFENEYLKGKNNFYVLGEEYDKYEKSSIFADTLTDYLIENTESFVFYKDTLISCYDMGFYPVNNTEIKYRKRRRWLTEHKRYIVLCITIILFCFLNYIN